MKTVSKALVGTVAAGAMAMTSATPALARDHDDGIDAGDVIAGAVIIGGIAALAGAFDRDDRRYREVARCRNDMMQLHRRDPITYPRTGEKAFFMNPHDYVEAQERARQNGSRVTAVYHSHVGAGAYLSEMDLEYAENDFFPFPESDQLVVAVLDAKVAGVGLFRRAGIDGPFQGRAILTETP